MTETPKIMPIRQTRKREPNLEPDAVICRIDIFSDIYNLARARGQLIAACAIPPNGGLAFENEGFYIHIVRQAACRLSLAGKKQPLLLQPGDVVALASGAPHKLAVENERTGNVSPCHVITAALHFHGIHGQTLTGGLPEVLLVRGDGSDRPVSEPSAAWIPMAIAAIELELKHPTVGSEVMMSKTIELLFVWMIRHYLGSDDPSGKGWPAGLKDMTIHRALSMMHADPCHAWRVSELARRIGQSRSSFAQKFLDVMGETPMRYLANWRMQLAGDLLESSNLHVAQIAEQVGYASQAAFGRVFRRFFGMSPTTYRDEHRYRDNSEAAVQ